MADNKNLNTENTNIREENNEVDNLNENVSDEALQENTSENTEQKQTSEDTTELENTTKNESLNNPAETPTEVVKKVEEEFNPADYENKTREEILDILAKLINQYPEKEIKKNVLHIKMLFEEKTAEYKAELFQKRAEERKKMSEEESENTEQEDLPIDNLPEKLAELLKEYNQKQKELKQQEKERQTKNLETKKAIIAKIDSLINKPEAFGKTFSEFKEIQAEWNETGEVPQNETREIWAEYNRAIEGFYNYVKINKDLRDLDLQKNTKIKTELCEKAEALTELDDVMEAQRRLQKLHTQWRETGPVENDLKEELWERFKKPTSVINEKHQEHLQAIKVQQEKNLESKTYLCEKAEEALNGEYKNNAEWKKASNLVQKYQKLWNSIGYVPKQYNQSIYDRFVTACDGFFNRMREHFDIISKERVENLKKKQDLLNTAVENMHRDDWGNATRLFKKIQEQWKNIGPVPRKHSDKIWKQFRVACNNFFERRREYFDKREELENNNLVLKTQLIEDIKEAKIENRENAVLKISEFQKRWQEIGYVPLKDKERIVSGYNTALDKIFETFGIDKTKRINVKLDRKLQTLENADADKIKAEIGKLRARIDEKEKEIKLQKNNLGFFAGNKGSEQMKLEYEKRIKHTEREVAELKTMIQKLEKI